MHFSMMQEAAQAGHGKADRASAALLLAVALSPPALCYFMPDLLTQTRGAISRAAPLQMGRALFVPLCLFFAAVIPAGTGLALLWSGRQVTDPRKRCWVQALAVLGSGIAVVVLVSGGPA